MYTRKNFKTKKSLLEAVKAGEEIEVYQPGGMWEGTRNGFTVIEGPHYPEPHRWYARVEIEDFKIVRFVS